jgi:serine/threonine protein kinase
VQEAAVVPPRPACGDQVDRFRLLREVYCGRNSSIFEAFEKRSGRTLALKVLAPELAVHPGPRSRFLRETELANRVSHPSILPVLDVGQSGERVFSVSRLESGDTLEDLAREAAGRKDDSYFVELARRFAAVVEAIALLHEAGVVHRDVTPANILIDAAGSFVLTDFGSALDAARSEPALDEWIGGTVRYMSPEQVVPGADRLDTAADVYALGLTFLELLTGKPPFPSCGDDELARLKLTRRPAAARSVNPYVPLGLDAIVRQAIEPNRLLRYPSAAEMARDLRRFVSHRRGSHRCHHHP